MSRGKIFCEHCNSVVLEYYHEGYKGKRGKCTVCNADFPLE